MLRFLAQNNRRDESDGDPPAPSSYEKAHDINPQSPQSYDFLRGGGAGPQRRRPRVDRVSTEKRLDYHPLGDSLFGAKAWSDACPMPAQVLQSVAYILLPPHDIDEFIDMSSRESIAVVNVPRAVSHAVRVLADELM